MTRSHDNRVVWTNVKDRASKLCESEATRVADELRAGEPDIQVEDARNPAYDAYDRAMQGI